MILIINPFCPVLFPDRRLWPADLGEICGAAGNKGAFFVCFSIASFSIFPTLLRSFQISLLVIYPVTQFSVIGCFVFFLLTLSSLVGVGGGACAHLSSSSSSPSLLLHPLFSSSAVYFSGEYSVGRTFLPVSPQCTSAHPQCSPAPVGCDWLVWWPHGTPLCSLTPLCIEAFATLLPNCGKLTCSMKYSSLQTARVSFDLKKKKALFTYFCATRVRLKCEFEFILNM